MKAEVFESPLMIYNDDWKHYHTPREACDHIATPKGVAAVFKLINYHYKHAHDKWDRSGSHDDSDKFVGN